jgi:hypothetical protein
VTDGWEDVRGWMSELGVVLDLDGAFVLPLLRVVEPHALEERFGGDRLLALMLKADEELASKRAQTVRMMREAGQRLGAPEFLETALDLEEENGQEIEAPRGGWQPPGAVAHNHSPG